MAVPLAVWEAVAIPAAVPERVWARERPPKPAEKGRTIGPRPCSRPPGAPAGAAGARAPPASPVPRGPEAQAAWPGVEARPRMAEEEGQASAAPIRPAREPEPGPGRARGRTGSSGPPGRHRT